MEIYGRLVEYFVGFVRTSLLRTTTTTSLSGSAGERTPNWSSVIKADLFQVAMVVPAAAKSSCITENDLKKQVRFHFFGQANLKLKSEAFSFKERLIFFAQFGCIGKTHLEWNTT